VKKSDLLIKNGLQMSTQKTYLAGQKSFIKFCDRFSLEYCPASQTSILAYIADCDGRNLRHGTIVNYLYAIRSMHLENGHGDILKDNFSVKRALKAIHTKQDNTCNQKLAIDHKIMKSLETLHRSKIHDTIVMWSAMTLAFFGLFRCNEITIPDNSTFCPNKNMTTNDISFHKGVNGTFMKVMLKQSKTDTIGTGVQVIIGCTETNVCAVCAMKNNLSLFIGNKKDTPLFVLNNGSILSRKVFVSPTRT
ncbi:unnamed protein product, partial [Owenia fusiformis]